MAGTVCRGDSGPRWRVLECGQALSRNGYLGIQACLAQLVEATGVVRPTWRSSLRMQIPISTWGCRSHQASAWSRPTRCSFSQMVDLSAAGGRGFSPSGRPRRHVRTKPTGSESRRTIIASFTLKGFSALSLLFWASCPSPIRYPSQKLPPAIGGLLYPSLPRCLFPLHPPTDQVHPRRREPASQPHQQPCSSLPEFSRTGQPSRRPCMSRFHPAAPPRGLCS